MRFVSTRGSAPSLSASAAMLVGMAPDRGLYVPERFDARAVSEFDGATTVAEVGERLLAPFFAGDTLQTKLGELCREAFDFPVPLTDVGEVKLLELFHGPTAAFKDFGARFLAGVFTRTVRKPVTILVATSGDTGGAVAAAFHRRPNIQVVVLYPKGGVSRRQEQQLVGFGDNVRSVAVRGTFDDCQALAKAAFADASFGSLSSANSINVGRLLPQMAYYAMASLAVWRQSGKATTFIVPTGNLGNACAALWARACGLPIDRVVLATNNNDAAAVYVETGRTVDKPTVSTLANAMDVGAPSNLERVRQLFGTFPRDIAEVLSAVTVDDERIRATIAAIHGRFGVAICPHTATAFAAHHQLNERTDSVRVLVATAHPAKFDDIVEPLIGPVPIPATLGWMGKDGRPTAEIDPTLGALRACLVG